MAVATPCVSHCYSPNVSLRKHLSNIIDLFVKAIKY
jgi:hypothetical protein